MNAPWTPDPERTGGLKACWCGHPMSHHPQHPAWYGASHMLPPKCTFCACDRPEEMPMQPPEAWFQTQEEFDAWLKRMHEWFAAHGFARTT